MKKPTQTLLNTIDRKFIQLYRDLRRLEILALTYDINLNAEIFDSMAKLIEEEQRKLR